MPINFLRLLLLLLGLSYVLSVSAIPATTTQNLKTQDKSALPYLTRLNTLKLEDGEELQRVDMDEEFIERRMVLDTQDYGGTGANTDHNPNIPSRV